MSAIVKSAKWFYHAFGISAIHETGRNAYYIIFARTFRMLSNGATTLVLGLFLSELKFSDFKLGLFLTLTLLGDVFLGGYLTLVADRVGRRKVILGGSMMMIMSGIVFALVENFWVLLIAAVFGVISATGADFGPFRSIEESMLSHLTTPKTRADVLSWYITLSTFGLAIGSEASGRIVHHLQDLPGWTLADAYHAIFWSCSIMGIVNALFAIMLTEECELRLDDEAYSQIPQTENNNTEPEPADDIPLEDTPATARPPWYKRVGTALSKNLSAISPATRSVMFKLWSLLAVDSLADGMVPFSLTNYYMDQKFHPAKSVLGDATGGAYLLGAASTMFAGPLARKIGLINTMVFTHTPSSAAVLLFPAPNNLFLTIALLFIRAGLNNLDQAPRAAFIAAVVTPQERTACMGITSMVRTMASMIGPSVTGLLAGNGQFWIAFVAAGAFRLAYDLGLYVMFVNIKLFQHESGGEKPEEARTPPRLSDEEEMELEPLDKLNDDSDLKDPHENSEDSVGSSSLR